MRIGITTPQRPKYNPSTKYPQQGGVNVSFTNIGKTPYPPSFRFNGIPASVVQLIDKGTATLKIQFTAGSLDPNQPISLNVGVSNDGDITTDPLFGMELIFFQASGTNELCFSPEPENPDPANFSNRYAFLYTNAVDAGSGSPIFRNGQNIIITNTEALLGEAEAPFFYVPSAITGLSAGQTDTISMTYDIQFKSSLTASEPGEVVQIQGILVLDFTCIA